MTPAPQPKLEDVFGKYVCEKCPYNPCHFIRSQKEKDRFFVRHVIMNLGCMLNPNSHTSPTSAEQVLELSKEELFHLQCMLEEELKCLSGQAKVRCPKCRAMLKKTKSLLERDYEETLRS